MAISRSDERKSRIQYGNRSKYYTACHDCKKRSSTCHGDCKEYAIEVIVGTLIEAEERKEIARREDEYMIHETRAIRVCKRSGKKLKKLMQNNSYLKRRG